VREETNAMMEDMEGKPAWPVEGEKVMGKFKVGDRVRVYGYARQLPSTPPLRGRTAPAICCDGTRVVVKEEFLVSIVFELNGVKYEAYKQQCRRLRKKIRRRVFIPEHVLKWLAEDDVRAQDTHLSETRCVEDDVEFVEVKRRKP
jgi:hypothetical protein